MQEMFSQLEIDQPQLFNINTTEGKTFVNSYIKFIKMEKNDIDNKCIHFAQWLNKKHTTVLINLYEQFENEFYNNN